MPSRLAGQLGCERYLGQCEMTLRRVGILRGKPLKRCGVFQRIRLRIDLEIGAGEVGMRRRMPGPLDCPRRCSGAAQLRQQSGVVRSEEHTSELQSPYVISYAVF